MLSRALFIMVVFAAIPLWCQVNTTDTGDQAITNTDVNLQMLTPPPVSGASYPTIYAAAEKSNLLSGGLTFTATHTDNALFGLTPTPVSDMSYSVWPTISLDKKTSRLHFVATYSPGFTIYQKTTSRNSANQNVGLEFDYRLSPHVTLSLRDSFSRSSDAFSQPDLLAATPIPGSAQAPTVAVIAPLAEQLTNTGNGTLTYQFSRSSMVGVGGSVTNLHYPDQSQVPGLFDSNSAGGSAFFSHRLSKKQYVGAQYQYQRILSYPTGGQYETQTHTIYLFYTVYLKPTLSLSFSGGPQYSDVPQPPLPNSKSWSPAASTSLGWQARHTNIAANYSRVVSNGGGLVGAFHSNSASASVRQQLTRSWNVGASAAYSIFKTVTPLSFFATPGGHTVSGTAFLGYVFGKNLNASLGYTRLHQNFGGISLINNAPDTNNEWVSISYTFARPIGR